MDSPARHCGSLVFAAHVRHSTDSEFWSARSVIRQLSFFKKNVFYRFSSAPLLGKSVRLYSSPCRLGVRSLSEEPERSARPSSPGCAPRGFAPCAPRMT
ncbi:hypothetical protein DB31_8950 [Hyalangium minutum]|uniref:Uncharacterized protein n=1 Tax=Hyalangium minutum TaxID=394096 RepID=A0A085WGC3_9BACT|nr:hypothetical protein DB31_8950 [Hyalangium minutum]